MATAKRALITGITGQDGGHLAELLHTQAVHAGQTLPERLLRGVMGLLPNAGLALTIARFRCRFVFLGVRTRCHGGPERGLVTFDELFVADLIVSERAVGRPSIR